MQLILIKITISNENNNYNIIKVLWFYPVLIYVCPILADHLNHLVFLSVINFLAYLKPTEY